MPIRLLKPYNGQAALTTFFGSAAEETGLLNTGGADMNLEGATDYLADMRQVTGSTAAVVRTASYYRMNSGSAQTLTLGLTGFWPVGKVITVKQEGAGKTTISPGTGITVVLGNGLTTAVTNGANYIGQLIKDSATQWTAFGGFGG
jgi:hypothetical protein